MSGYPPSDSYLSSALNQPLLTDNPPTSPDFTTQEYPNSHPRVTSGNKTCYPASNLYHSRSVSSTYPASGDGLPAVEYCPEVSPSAPPLTLIEKIPGYETVTFDEEIVAPPSAPPWKPEFRERTDVENLPIFNEEEVQEAVIQYAKKNVCFGSRTAKNIIIKDITMIRAYQYKFESFAEKRRTAWHFVPYKGGCIDGPLNGPAPSPYDIVVTPRKLFKDGKKKVEVPHTAFVKPCHMCVGNTRVRCEICLGNGRTRCNKCKGHGTRRSSNKRRRYQNCRSCHGSGMYRCNRCIGTGQITCKTCAGKGQLKAYVELTVIWTNHVDEYISETNVPKELVHQVSGRLVLQEESFRVFPIKYNVDERLCNASQEIVHNNMTSFPSERILKQRHCLQQVPIAEVNYTWKEKTGLYYVYGYERKVYFNDFPQRCCCCTII